MPSKFVARPDAIRGHNLGMLLTEVHRDGELTRAELTTRLGMSRSTIGALVNDLSKLGLLEQRIPNGGERAGRPSFVVVPSPGGPYVIAVDVDVTHVFVAAVGVGGRILAREAVTTAGASSPAQLVAHIATAMGTIRAALLPSARLVAVGVSIPGTVNRADGYVHFAPNLSWTDQPFGALLGQELGNSVPVLVGNDADLALSAEQFRGAARGVDNVLYVMGRVGVGAAIIANGLPVHGRDGHAGEVGHTVVDPSGPNCHCGKRGCLEVFIGDTALLRLAGRDLLPTVEAVGSVLADARDKNPQALEAVMTVANHLGAALGWLVNILNPELILLGGTLSGILDIAPERVASALYRQTMGIADELIPMSASALEADAMLLGAAEMAFAALLADPLLIY